MVEGDPAKFPYVAYYSPEYHIDISPEIRGYAPLRLDTSLKSAQEAKQLRGRAQNANPAEGGSAGCNRPALEDRGDRGAAQLHRKIQRQMRDCHAPCVGNSPVAQVGRGFRQADAWGAAR